jgi:hypothetical protein
MSMLDIQPGNPFALLVLSEDERKNNLNGFQNIFQNEKVNYPPLRG